MHFIAAFASISLFTAIATDVQASESNAPIAYPTGAKIFASYTDELPMVINYYTQLSNQEIIRFYQEKYGEAIKSEMKRGRLALYFNLQTNTLRVIISKQGNFQQVDALLK